ncbi:WD40 repeat domain-containing protein (plasmid) [Nocardia sp. NBC_01377]|uniref:nSTAND1 domain-containing NTPase n=1 Tax=Nocardia sp. NBC_01377 TaxID=2903595 RepID=UPI0032463E90
MEGTQSTASGDSGLLRKVFVARFNALYLAAGEPKLEWLARTASERVRAARPPGTPDLAFQRISAWRSGQIPKTFDTVEPVLQTLIDKVTAAAESQQPPAGGEIMPELLDVHAWQRLWKKANAEKVPAGGRPRTGTKSKARAWTDDVVPEIADPATGHYVSPYRGLARFVEADARFFFGRETAIGALVQRLSQRLQDSGILLVSGVSGAGKSSLLRAGVLPWLRESGLPETPEARDWPNRVFSPGKDPLDALAIAITQGTAVSAATVRGELDTTPDRFALITKQAVGAPHDPDMTPNRVLLVVDQFEQVFTQCTDDTQRSGFITALHAAATAGTALVVLVVRADFESRCTDCPELTDAVQNRYLVTAMNGEQLAMVITEPARIAGSRVDDALRDRLLREIRTGTSGLTATAMAGVESTAGVLPLLSHALDTAWRNRAGDTLTVADYQRTGGIAGAIEAAAQRVYDVLPAHQQAVARQVFTQLAVADADGIDTADRIPRTDLTRIGSVIDVEAVLEAFTGQRLLTLGPDTVEVAHEIVFRAWPLLRDVWLAETHDIRVISARLRTAAAEWRHRGRDAAYLYSGSILDTAVTAADRVTADPGRYPPLGAVEAEFLAAATGTRTRRTLQRRAVIVVLLVLVIGLAATTIVALQASGSAARQRDLAIARQLISQSTLLATSDPFGSKLDAIAAWRLSGSPEAKTAMIEAAVNPHLAVLTGHTGTVNSVAFAPDGRTLATGGIDGRVRVWDTATHSPIGDPLTGHTGAVNSVAFAPDGRTLATGDSLDGTVRIWNIATHSPIGDPLPGHTGSVNSVAFAPDGRTLATGDGSDGTVRLWDAIEHRPIGGPLTGHTGTVSVAFAPDGRTLATGGSDGRVRLWDLATHSQIGDPLTGHANVVLSVAFAPDGRTLATGGYDGTVRLWDLATHSQIGDALTGHTSTVNAVAFAPDGRTLAAGDDDGAVRLWNTATHRPIGDPLLGHTGAVNSVAFAPDGRTLATGGIDRAVRLWDLVVTHRPIGDSLPGHTGAVNSVAFAPDGRTLATGGNDTVRLWNTATHSTIGDPLTDHHSTVNSMAFAPDGRTLATGDGYDGTVRLWDAIAQRPISEPLTGHTGAVSSAAFAPDSRTLATGGSDGTVQLWNTATHAPIGDPLTDHTSVVLSMAFAPDGRTLATGDGDGAVRLWDTATHRPIGDPFTGDTGAVWSVAFAPDGRTLATGDDGTVRLWDTATHSPIGDPLTANTGAVRSVAFAPDGRTLAAGGSDGTVRLLNTAAHRPIGNPLTDHTGNVSVAFAPDGRTLATGDYDGTVRLWDTGFLVDPLDLLCGQTPGMFTPDAWNRYVTGAAYRQLCP